MNQRWIAAAFLAMPLAAASAQSTQSASDAEPAVVTSPAAAPRSNAAATLPAATPSTASSPASAPGAEARAPRPASRPASASTQTPGSRTPSAPATTARGSADRIELEATQITGNAELPRVMYVVPWKRAELGELAGRPAKSLLDEVLTPVDRDVFRRQNRYYEALQPDAARAAPEGEK